MRPLPFALASIVSTLALSPGAFPVGSLPAALSPLATASVAGGARRTASARAEALGPAALRFGRSLGSPTEGRLVGGEHLDAAPYLRVLPVCAGDDLRWGLEPLVSLLDRAARAVRRQFPDAVTSVGDLSRAGGGDVERHRSHESGRDADVVFFARTAGGRPLLPSRFVPYRPDGAAIGWPGAYFDDARNWALVAALVTDPEAHVTHLFVASSLRARLLAYAERAGAPAEVRVRAAEAMQQPRGVLPHDDHFHVRIACPAHMNGCVENPAPRAVHRPGPPLDRARGGAPTHHPMTLPPARTGPGSAPADEPRRRAVEPHPTATGSVDDVDG